MASGPVIDTRVVTRGFKEAKRSMVRIDVRADAAASAGLVAVTGYGVKMVRSKLRGAPRWDRRGRSRIWTEPVDLGMYGPSHNKPRAGAPGRFTGVLSKSVGKVKRPRRRSAGVFVGGVGIGSKANNPRKAKLERAYPFFMQAMRQTEERALPLWEKAFVRVANRD